MLISLTLRRISHPTSQCLVLSIFFFFVKRSKPNCILSLNVFSSSSFFCLELSKGKAVPNRAGSARMGSGSASLAVPVNSKAFMDLDESEVSADQKFFHKFFATKNELSKRKSGRRSMKAPEERELKDGDDKDDDDDEEKGDDGKDVSDDDDDDDDGIAEGGLDMAAADRLLAESSDEEEAAFAEDLAESLMEKDEDEVPDWADELGQVDRSKHL